MAQVLVLTGVTQAGKSTGAEFLKNSYGFTGVISHTTRELFSDEEDGVHYHKVTREEFMEKVEQDGFFEYEEIYGNLYGLSKEAFNEAVKGDTTVVLAINVEGAKTVKEYLGDKCTVIFVAPPSIDVLLQRVEENRKGDTERIAAFAKEMELKDSFDHLIYNDDLLDYYQQLGEIAKKLI